MINCPRCGRRYIDWIAAIPGYVEKQWQQNYHCTNCGMNWMDDKWRK